MKKLKIFELFKVKPTTDIKIFERLGKKSYIHNGIGYGFVSDAFLYDNCLIEIGFGRSTSGYGDWGGGASRATTSPLRITIDKDYIIKRMTTDSFSSIESSLAMERIAKQIIDGLKVGNKFVVEDEEFKRHIDTILNVIPCKSHIGHDVFQSPHMLEHYTDKKNMSNYNFKDPKCLKKDK